MTEIKPEIRIPFNRPTFMGSEVDYIREAIRLQKISGNGVFTQRCESLLQEILGVARVLLVTSCTHALELAALLLDLEEGDEVILPSFTFVSTVNAFVLRRAKPIFADIRADTLNIDESGIEALMTPRTAAIVPVHYAGVGCEMTTICDIAQKRGAVVIEDNAQGLFGKYRGEYLGTLGAMSTVSFHETKNVTCGEGGALFLNDESYVERAEIIREKGTDRSRFLRGEVDRYTWRDLGSSYLPADILAAFLFAQLEARDRIRHRRREIWHHYYDGLRDWAAVHDVRLPTVPVDSEQSHHLFYLILPSFERRQALIEHLRRRGILAVFHYVPLHLSSMGRSLGGREGDCPVTEAMSERLVRLPFYNSLSREAQDEVIGAVLDFD